jgi:hypothetical protein
MNIRLIFIFLLNSIYTSHGELIISFNGNDSGTSNLNFGNLAASWSSGKYAVLYSPLNKAFAGNLTSGAPSLAVGVYATNNSISKSPAAYMYRDSVTPDQFRVGWERDGGTTNTSFRYLLMAPASGWLALKDGARFDAASYLKVSTLYTNQTSIGSINFVVEDGGNYFISTTRIASTTSTLQIIDPNNSLWTLFDSTATNFQGINPTTLTGLKHVFTDVKSIGLFIQGTVGWGGTADGYISLNNWIANAAAILPVISPPSATIATYAGVTIEGGIGATYGIQATTDLSESNGWIGVANVTLSQPKQIWYDSQSTTQLQKRFYRVVVGPISIPQ